MIKLILTLLIIVSCSTKHAANVNNGTEQVVTEADISLSAIEKMCQDQEIPEALKLANKNYEPYKNQAQYWNIVGSCFLKDLRPLKARLFFLRALEVEKAYVPALNNLGVVYWYLGKHEDSLSYFRRAVAIDSSNSIVSYNLGRLYLWYGLHQASGKFLKLSADNNSKVKQLHGYIAANEVMLANYKQAVESFKESDLSDRNLIGLYAVALKKTGDNPMAEEKWDNAKFSPEDPMQWLWIEGGGK